MSQSLTVERILNAAELLFAEHGFSDTSLRSITSRAGVNLAAVNYHFGSKKALIQAVFSRFLDPFVINLEKALDELENSSDTPELEPLLHLLVDQIMMLKPRDENNLSVFTRLVGLAFNETQGHLKRYLNDIYGNVFQRYFKILVLTCPHLHRGDMFWRVNFILGSAVFTLSGANALRAIAETDYGVTDDLEDILRRMVPFMAAGLRAHI
ncbi:MAG: TetR/AcrR family transcriptional regulator [Endozoicomonas sp. (ex Botrylloides leachii)]|nr:TetR/AcrR family transcriptional regulator [Endozoicomonas sp. (ex Botrylloides leachii)]